MTTYRLPDGIEIASLDVNGGPGNQAWVTHPTLGQILIGRDKLTEVTPPLPPEPPIGTVLFDGGDRAWQRVRDDRDPQWRHDSLMCSWETMVRENGPLTRVVPDPAADPALVERVAQAMRDANTPEAWTHQQIVPFDHFAKVAVEEIFGATREAEQP